MDKQLQSMLCLTYCSFYSQEPLACLLQTPCWCQNGRDLNEMWAWSKFSRTILSPGPLNLQHLPTPMRMKSRRENGKMMLNSGQLLHTFTLACTWSLHPANTLKTISWILSLDCYHNFVKGWMREVLVKSIDDKRIVTGMVGSWSHNCSPDLRHNLSS